ncbi:hypothetical protein FHL81_11435 [Agrobacterium tumefaciens]|nr:hypothetical protein FHL81_11435 [Agrobacterium tumefaciens]
MDSLSGIPTLLSHSHKKRPARRPVEEDSLIGGYRRLCKGMQWENDPMEWSIRRGYAAKDIAPY